MKLFNELCEHLSDMKVEWHLCGGLAIDAYLGKITREHKDIDITVSFDDMRECVKYLKSKGWEIDAPVGKGRFASIEVALEDPEMKFNNIWCYKKDADFIKSEKIDDSFKVVKFINREQTELDFIEILFNKIENGIFYYQKNHSIMRETQKAFIKKERFSILAPEITLLHKSRTPDDAHCKHDFDVVINRLEKERYDWLMEAMDIEYPEGHPWTSQLPR